MQVTATDGPQMILEKQSPRPTWLFAATDHNKDFNIICCLTWGCYNKVPETGWLINTRSFFLRILELGKSKFTVPSGKCWIQGKDPLSGLHVIHDILVCHQQDGGGQWSFVKSLISFVRHLSCDLIISQWSDILTPSNWRQRF